MSESRSEKMLQSAQRWLDASNEAADEAVDWGVRGDDFMVERSVDAADRLYDRHLEALKKAAEFATYDRQRGANP